MLECSQGTMLQPAPRTPKRTIYRCISNTWWRNSAIGSTAQPLFFLRERYWGPFSRWLSCCNQLTSREWRGFDAEGLSAR